MRGLLLIGPILFVALATGCSTTHVEKLARIAPDATEPVVTRAPINAAYILAFRVPDSDDVELHREVTILADAGDMIGFVPDEWGLQGKHDGDTFALPRPPEGTRYVAWYLESDRHYDDVAVITALTATRVIGDIGAAKLEDYVDEHSENGYTFTQKRRR